jgi:hypothetical protein
MCRQLPRQWTVTDADRTELLIIWLALRVHGCHDAAQALLAHIQRMGSPDDRQRGF